MTVRNDLDRAFEEARQEGHALLIPYLTAGFPDRKSFVDLAVTILESGGDALEIGIPFSDPLLDGVSIQGSQQRALDAGVTPADCLAYAEEIHARSRKPLLFMGAYNPIYAYGVSRFCRDAARVGISALIVPDVPVEEQGELLAGTAENDLHLIQLVAPTSTDERIARVCSLASGFIYCISVVGLTGARSSLAETARPLVGRVRHYTDLPLAVGFGIAGPEQARAVATFADGVIVASRLVDLVNASPREQRAERVAAFVRSLEGALIRSRQETDRSTSA